MARQGVFNVPEIMWPVDATSFIQSIASIVNGTNYTMETLLRYQTVTGSYNISAKFCRPDRESGSKAVIQVLSHGIGLVNCFPLASKSFVKADASIDSISLTGISRTIISTTATLMLRSTSTDTLLSAMTVSASAILPMQIHILLFRRLQKSLFCTD
jgi:hypothetical protein